MFESPLGKITDIALLHAFREFCNIQDATIGFYIEKVVIKQDSHDENRRELTFHQRP